MCLISIFTVLSIYVVMLDAKILKILILTCQLTGILKELNTCYILKVCQVAMFGYEQKFHYIGEKIPNLYDCKYSEIKLDVKVLNNIFNNCVWFFMPQFSWSMYQKIVYSLVAIHFKHIILLLNGTSFSMEAMSYLEYEIKIITFSDF